MTYNGSTDNPVNAGTYTVVATFNGTAIYEAATATRTFVIRKAMPTVTVNGGTFTYNGSAASGHRLCDRHRRGSDRDADLHRTTVERRSQ